MSCTFAYILIGINFIPRVTRGFVYQLHHHYPPPPSSSFYCVSAPVSLRCSSGGFCESKRPRKACSWMGFRKASWSLWNATPERSTESSQRTKKRGRRLKKCTLWYVGVLQRGMRKGWDAHHLISLFCFSSNVFDIVRGDCLLHMHSEGALDKKPSWLHSLCTPVKCIQQGFFGLIS